MTLNAAFAENLLSYFHGTTQSEVLIRLATAPR